MEEKNEALLAYTQSHDAVQLDCTLKLRELFSDDSALGVFKGRMEAFCRCNSDNGSVYKLEEDTLHYKTEQLVPTKKNKRRPLLLIFGNPASRSIKDGMFFSPKKDGKEHRFWRQLLGKTQDHEGVANLSLDDGSPTKDRNERRKEALLKLEYDSMFRVGLYVYLSMPSPAGGKWAGVAGIRKLLGKKAFEKVMTEERKRFFSSVKHFLRTGGIALAFQKDAWNGLRSDGDPEYSLERAKAGNLRGTLRALPETPFWGIPPTRLLGPSRDILRKVLKLLW